MVVKCFHHQSITSFTYGYHLSRTYLGMNYIAYLYITFIHDLTSY